MFLFLRDKGAEKISVLPREIWDISIFQKYNLQKSFSEDPKHPGNILKPRDKKTAGLKS